VHHQNLFTELRHHAEVVGDKQDRGDGDLLQPMPPELTERPNREAAALDADT